MHRTTAALDHPVLRTCMSTLNLGGRQRSSFTRRHSPMSVAMEQCATVGVNRTLRRPSVLMHP